jgi:hypothetical protein
LENSLSKKWVIAILLVVICLSFRLDSAVGAAESSLSRVIFPDDRDPPFIIQQQTPESTLSVLPDEERARFIEVAQVFTHPHTRNVVFDGGLNARTLIENSLDYDGYQIQITGKLISIRLVENLLPRGWQNAYVIVIDDGTAWLPVLYRGHVSNFTHGDELTVNGVFVNAGQAVHADVVHVKSIQSGWINKLPIDLPFDLSHDFPLVLPIALVAFLFLGVLATLVGISRRLFTFLLIPLVILVGLTSCEIHMETIVRPDGSVRVGTKIGESVENIDFLREVPGMQRYLLSWLTHLRDDGVLVENYVSGEKEFFYLQSNYATLVDFSSVETDEESNLAPDSWVYATSYKTATSDCFRYIASVNPQSLYTTPPNTEQAIIREMNKQLDQIELKYRVSLPGQILYSNTDQRTGNRLEWQMAMDQQHQVVAESCFHRISGDSADWTWAWVGIGGLGLVTVGMWIWALRSLKLRHKVQN